MFLGIIGFLMVAALVTLLISKKASPIVAFILVPIVGGLIAGFSPMEIVDFAVAGLAGNLKNTMMICFAVLFFCVIIDTGAFERIVARLISAIHGNITMLMILTVIITIIGHLDGSGPSTFLISLVPLLPIYKKMKINPLIALCLCCGTAGIANAVPWGGPAARAATGLGVESAAIWRYGLPMQITGILCMLLLACYFAKKEKARLAASGELVQVTESFGLESQLDPELLRPKMFFINLLLIVVVVATLVVMPDVPPHIVFMVAFAVALLINYPNSKDQLKVFKLHAGEAWFVASIIFAAGFFSGVMSGAELPTHMAELLMSIIPESFLKHVHVVFALFEPIMDPIGMGSDVQAYGIWPVLANILAPLDPARVGAFMVMPFTISNYIAPTTGATYLAIGLAGVEIGDHMKFCFKYFWAIGVIMVLVALVLGVVPL